MGLDDGLGDHEPEAASLDGEPQVTVLPGGVNLIAFVSRGLPAEMLFVMPTEDEQVMAGVAAATPEQWAALWAAVDQLLQEPEWVRWVPSTKRPDGVIVLGWPEYSPAMNATLTALGRVGAITPAFDWPAWRQGWHDPDGTRMRTGPAADAVRYLTAVVRGERVRRRDAGRRHGRRITASRPRPPAPVVRP